MQNHASFGRSFIGGRLVFWFSQNICQIVKIYFCLTRHGDRTASFCSFSIPKQDLAKKNLQNYPVFIGTFYLKSSFSEKATKLFAIFLMVWTFTWGRLRRFLWPSQKSWTLVVKGGKTSTSFSSKINEVVG